MFYELNNIPHQAYVALDISKAMLLHHPRGAKHVVADLEKPLPLGDESFDLAVCFFTLEHIEHLDTFFSEVYRILRSEGNLFVGHFFQRRAFEWTAHQKTFKIKQYKRTSAELQNAAQANGFQMEIVPLYDKTDHTGDVLVGSK
jgi:ubiquinone/menaquinone biosynthesis C-methylase UbiE